jgi:hypothetical protein
MKTKKPPPRKCQICDRVAGDGPGEIKKIIRHHLCYAPEITADLCYGCHSWLHNTARSWNHPFIKAYGKDIGPWVFAAGVVGLYRNGWRRGMSKGEERKDKGKRKKQCQSTRQDA